MIQVLVEQQLERGVQRVQRCVYAMLVEYMWHVQRLVHGLKRIITIEF